MRRLFLAFAICFVGCVMFLYLANIWNSQYIIIRRCNLPLISENLMLVNETYLSAVVPRPYGYAVTNHSPEVTRRMIIVIETWKYYIEGREDAERKLGKGIFLIKGSAPLNEVERRYVGLLNELCSIEFEQVRSKVVRESQLAYICGYNEHMADAILKRFDRKKFPELIKMAIVCVYGDDYKKRIREYVYNNEFFIPNVFGMGGNNIRVVTE